MSRVAQLASGAAQPAVIATAAGPIAALQAGSDDAPPVLLVPGYTGSKEDFAPLLDPLAAAGFRPTAIDLPGQFESPGPDDPACYTPALLAAAVLDVAADLGRRVHLLGHSFGGLVARAAVLERRDAIASLVLMSSGPAAIDGQRRMLIEQLEPMLPHGLAVIYDLTEATAAAEAGYVAPDPELAELLRRRFLAGSPAMLQGMGTALRDEPDRVAELATCHVPTLVIYGTDDDAWPPSVQAEMAQRLGAQQAVIAGAAHSPAVENPEPSAAALAAFWHAQP